MNKRSLVQYTVALLMLLAILYGRPVNVPDNLQSLHGLPLVWGTHQLATIAGPVDYWVVSLTNLAIDIMIWFVILFVVPFVVKE